MEKVFAEIEFCQFGKSNAELINVKFESLLTWNVSVFLPWEKGIIYTHLLRRKKVPASSCVPACLLSPHTHHSQGFSVCVCVCVGSCHFSRLPFLPGKHTQKSMIPKANVGNTLSPIQTAQLAGRSLKISKIKEIEKVHSHAVTSDFIFIFHQTGCGSPTTATATADSKPNCVCMKFGSLGFQFVCVSCTPIILKQCQFMYMYTRIRCACIYIYNIPE